MLQCVAACCSVLQCAAGCCSVLQCVLGGSARVACSLCGFVVHFDVAIIHPFYIEDCSSTKIVLGMYAKVIVKEVDLLSRRS